jgi:HK97 family phage major capsid protein
MTIEELKARLAELNDTATAIQAKADAEKRDLTDEEQTQLEAVMGDFEKTEADIKRRERLAAQGQKLTASAGRRTTHAADDDDGALRARSIRAAVSSPAERGRWGWHNFGDFTSAVRAASTGREVDSRLQNAALSTYGSEGVGADGGFAIPPEFRSEILKKVVGEESLLASCDQVQTGGYSITVPKDEATPWGTAGIQGYWDGEAAASTQKKPALENTTIRVHKLTALVPVTEELLEDAPALGSYVQSKAADVLDFKVTDAIINGSGAGQPLGILNAPCLVTQAAEASQVSATIHGLNLVKMWARMPARWRSKRGVARASRRRARAHEGRPADRSRRGWCRDRRTAGVDAPGRHQRQSVRRAVRSSHRSDAGLQTGRHRRRPDLRIAQPVRGDSQGRRAAFRLVDSPLVRPGRHGVPLRASHGRSAVVVLGHRCQERQHHLQSVRRAGGSVTLTTSGVSRNVCRTECPSRGGPGHRQFHPARLVVRLRKERRRDHGRRAPRRHGSETIDVALYQATDTSGTGAKSLKAITQLAASAAANDSKQVIVSARADELDVDGGFSCVAVRIVTGGATGGTVNGQVWGSDIRYQPAANVDNASVVQIVV